MDIDQAIRLALKSLGGKPTDSAKQSEKKAFSESLSHTLAQVFANELIRRGMKEARPTENALDAKSGAERRMSGGIGAKKVDVTWATEEGGLIFAISLKSISFRDGRSGNFQKNLTNRRGDMLFEGVTLHRRFPYAVLAGVLMLDKESRSDDSPRRNSTFHNAHELFRLFTGRDDPAGRDEQYERLYIMLFDADRFQPDFTIHAVGSPEDELTFDEIFEDLIELIAERNIDFYEAKDGKLKRRRVGGGGGGKKKPKKKPPPVEHEAGPEDASVQELPLAPVARPREEKPETKPEQEGR